MPERRYLLILILVTIILLSVPYVVGFQAGNSQSQFGGFLINPIDGQSYLAKMLQGARGEWKFKLPYTAEPGEGAFLFLFYLGLGHLSRLAQIPVIVVFHAARLICSIWLIINIDKLLWALFENKREIKIGIFLAVLGSGLGWMAVLGGRFTSDLWVAEAYPFLSMYTNPHFSLGLGLMIYILLPNQQDRLVSNLLTGLLLGLIQPFAVVILCIVRLVQAGLRIYHENIRIKAVLRSGWFWPLMGFCLTGGMVILYQYWAILSDPVLAQWHQQNITLKPQPLDLLISLSPCLILGALGARKAWNQETGKTLVMWAGISLLLVFTPWSLQRRFLTGIFLPLAALSVFGLRALGESTPLKINQWVIVVFFLALPTNLIVIMSGLQAISEKNPDIFIDGDLVRGLQWIDTNTAENDLILADAEHGLYVPSYTGRRVIYGHPFETIRADLEKDFVDRLYNREQADLNYYQVLQDRDVDYVIYKVGHEEGFGNWLSTNLDLVYRSNEISIYSRQRE